MFSRCDHHDQKAPGGFLAPQPSYSAPFPLEAHQEPHPDLLSAHHWRLESLLDSALATLTLIHDIAPHQPFDISLAACYGFPTGSPSANSNPYPEPPFDPYDSLRTDLRPDEPDQKCHTPVESLPSHAPSAPAERQRHVVRPDLIFRLDLENTTSDSDSLPTPGDLFAAMETKNAASCMTRSSHLKTLGPGLQPFGVSCAHFSDFPQDIHALGSIQEIRGTPSQGAPSLKIFHTGSEK
ncbi:hypothetical protein B0H13DRAFT_2301496 [Mycena leptocephala]|nr:hypothetical protein B0H13DRAFT_2301496 [Mycena leptocephala]